MESVSSASLDSRFTTLSPMKCCLTRSRRTFEKTSKSSKWIAPSTIPRLRKPPLGPSCVIWPRDAESRRGRLLRLEFEPHPMEAQPHQSLSHRGECFVYRSGIPVDRHYGGRHIEAHERQK